jgi:hypothetical protein
MNSLHHLPAGHTLTVSIFDGAGYVQQVQDPTIGQRVTNAAAVVYGPYMLDRSFTTQGAVSVVIAEADIAANIPSTAQAAMLDAIPTADQDDSATVWNDGGVLKVSTAP